MKSEGPLSDTSASRGKPAAGVRVATWFALALLPAAVVLRALAFRSPELVERYYSQGVYPRVSGGLSALTGRMPFSVAEAGVLLGMLALGIVLVRGLRARRWRRGRWHAVGRAVLAAWALAGALLLAFDLSWGLNYARPPLAERLELDPGLPSVEEIEDLARRAARGASALRAGLGQAAEVPVALGQSFRQLDTAIHEAFVELSLPGDRVGSVSTPAKPLIVSPLMSRLGISGIYVPFTAEPSVNGDVPAASLPLVVAHEKAHRRGITDEGEANLVAVMVGLRSRDPIVRYTAHLEVAARLIGALSRVDRDRAAAAWDLLGPGPRTDLAAIGEFWDRYRGLATEVADRVNDAYLRSNRVPDGVRSYGRVVDLLVALDRESRLELVATP